MHPLIPLAVLKLIIYPLKSAIQFYCAPTYTACGIETLSLLLSLSRSLVCNCAPTYTACGIETSQLCLADRWYSEIVHPLIPLAVLKLTLHFLHLKEYTPYCAPTYTACGIETRSVRYPGLPLEAHCAPTYTACGIETRKWKFHQTTCRMRNCAPTYTACGIETRNILAGIVCMYMRITHPLIPLAVLKLVTFTLLK